MSTEQDVASPAAAVLERPQRRTTPQKRKQVCSDSDSLKKMLAERCSTQSSTCREWMPKGAGPRAAAVHGGAESAAAALVGASGVKMMRGGRRC